MVDRARRAAHFHVSRHRMGLLFDIIAPKLEQRFQGRGMRREAGSTLRVIFPAINSSVGDLEILDEGNDVTLIYGKFTHDTFGVDRYPPNTESEIAELDETVECFLRHLEALFCDRVVMWRESSTDFGFCELSRDDEWLPSGRRYYVWSGPLRDSGG
jgi:hypothetical protein